MQNNPHENSKFITLKQKETFFKKIFLVNLQDASRFQNIKISGEPLKFLKGQKSKDPEVKILS